MDLDRIFAPLALVSVTDYHGSQKTPTFLQKERTMSTIAHRGILAVGLALQMASSISVAFAGGPEKTNSQTLQHWRESRFGMFIHWGPVSLTEGEISWSRANSNPACPNNGSTPVAVYDNLYKRFNPTRFDARQWVAVAKAAGMKYMVLTAKHCDGFLLWDSKVDGYNIMHTPFKRDVCDELARAAREAGLQIGWYFSPMDWRDPDFRTSRNTAFIARMQGEIQELLTRYGQIDLLWFDWDGRKAMYDQATTYPLVKQLQPKILLTNRLDLQQGNNDRQMLSPFADYYTPEQSIGNYDDQRPWESCMTISRKGQWAWGGPKDGVKTFAECMNMLIRCAGGDGNLLLNVGPMANGEIAPEQADRLREMGAWLAKYGESIYGTRGGPFKPGQFGVSTRKGQTIYLHIQHWPGETLTLPAIPAKVVRGIALTGGKVTIKQTSGAIDVALPRSDRQEIDTIIALELDRAASAIAPLTTATASQLSAARTNALAAKVLHNTN
jgi:alpha-L-fucosidase